MILPGSVTFVGTLYSFGATLSFTVAHASIVALRRKGDPELLYRARPNLRFRGVDWPLFALLGGVATGISFVVILVQNPTTRWVGLGWLGVGFAGYAVYRRRYVHVPMTETVKAPPLLAPALALEYRMILSPLVDSAQSREAVHLACRLAAERRSAIVADPRHRRAGGAAARRGRCPSRSSSPTTCSTRRTTSASSTACA